MNKKRPEKFQVLINYDNNQTTFNWYILDTIFRFIWIVISI